MAGATVAAAVAVGLLAGFVLPRLDALWPGRQIAQAFRDSRPCPDSVLASAGYIEPSLVFLTATSTLLTDGAGAANHLKANACAVAAVDAKESSAFMAAFAGASVQPLPIAKAEGVNFSNGQAGCGRSLPAAGRTDGNEKGRSPALARPFPQLR